MSTLSSKSTFGASDQFRNLTSLNCVEQSTGAFWSDEHSCVAFQPRPGRTMDVAIDVVFGMCKLIHEAVKQAKENEASFPHLAPPYFRLVDHPDTIPEP